MQIEYLDGEARPKVSPRMRRGAEGDAALGTLDGTKTTLIPDVSFFFPERFAGLSYEDQDEPPFSPDIAIEVRSRGDSQSYLQRKIARYLPTGAAQRFTNEPFPWFTFDVADVFRVLDGLPDWME